MASVHSLSTAQKAIVAETRRAIFGGRPPLLSGLRTGMRMLKKPLVGRKLKHHYPRYDHKLTRGNNLDGSDVMGDGEVGRWDIESDSDTDDGKPKAADKKGKKGKKGGADDDGGKKKKK